MCAGAFFYRINSSSALEEFLTEECFEHCGLETAGPEGEEPTLTVVDRFPDGTAPTLRAWMRDASAASLRRLWDACRSAAKSDIESLTDSSDSPARTKLSALVIADLFQKARQKALPILSHCESPGPRCLQEVSDNFRAGGPFSYIAWESYTSTENERLAEPIRPIEDVLSLSEVLRIRAAAHASLDLITFASYATLQVF